METPESVSEPRVAVVRVSRTKDGWEGVCDWERWDGRKVQTALEVASLTILRDRLRRLMSGSVDEMFFDYVPETSELRRRKLWLEEEMRLFRKDRAEYCKKLFEDGVGISDIAILMETSGMQVKVWMGLKHKHD